MKLVGLLSWYEEPRDWLAAAITSYSRIGLDHLIAVDGAYEAFPDARPRSSPGQYEVIYEVCRALGIGSTVITPGRPWNSEIEKRTFMFRQGSLITEVEDWYVVIDADEVVTDIRCNVRKRLETTGCLVGEVSMWQFADPLPGHRDPEVVRAPFRKFFRALPGLHVGERHFEYRALDALLWGHEDDPDLAQASKVNVDVQHRSELRGAVRKLAQQEYYRRRREDGAELGRCRFCEQPAEVAVPHDYRLEEGVVTQREAEVCAQHVKRAWDDNVVQIIGLSLGQASIDAIAESFNRAVGRAGIEVQV